MKQYDSILRIQDDGKSLTDLIKSNELPLINGFDGTTGKEIGDKWLVCIHQFERCKYQCSVGDGAILICANYPECLKEGCYIENRYETL